jgi:HK97 gp10 family phage protein
MSFKNLNKVLKAIESKATAIEKETVQALAESAILVHGTAVKSIQSHQSKGITYGRHTASKGGFPPNTDTGKLVSEIDWEIDGNTGIVGTNLKYGMWLEFGTKNIEARPWLGPAYQKNLPKIIKLFTNAVKKGVKS